MTNPSVFLSYSHDSAAHKAWVRKLAEDLRGQGVDATLDEWDLRHGADLVAFMEAGIREAERVLMVCSSNYVRKAEQRKGGAGYEGMIVTSHVARSTDTVKFIPLVRDNPSEPLLPDFLGPRGSYQETNQISSVRPRGRNTLPSFDSSDKMELVASSHGR
jgi:hypothetical protein